MKKKLVRCWSAKEKCQCGETVEVFFTVPDFGDCEKLFICLGCGAIFAVDPDRESYSKTPFEALRNTLNCPVCQTSLSETRPYPESYMCQKCKTVGSYIRADKTIPSPSEKTVTECYDPYTSLANNVETRKSKPISIIGYVLFSIGIITVVSINPVIGHTQLTSEEKIQQSALATVCLSIGAWLAWGRKKPKG